MQIRIPRRRGICRKLFGGLKVYFIQLNELNKIELYGFNGWSENSYEVLKFSNFNEYLEKLTELSGGTLSDVEFVPEVIDIEADE